MALSDMPCRVCGHDRVEERRVREREMSLAQTTPDFRVVRRCLNPQCISNTNPREMSIADVV